MLNGHKNISITRLSPNIFLSLWIALTCGLILILIPEIILGLTPAIAVWFTFITLLFFSWIAWRQAVSIGDNPWISPLFLYIAVSLAFQTASGLLLIIHWEPITAITGWDSLGLINMLKYLPKVSWLILLGALGAYIGLLLPVRFLTVWLPRLDWEVDESRFSLRASILIPLIILSFYLAAKPGILPLGFQFIGWILGEFGKVLFIASILQILNYGKSAKRWKIVAILWPLSYIPSVLYGVRSAIVWPVIFFVWTYLAVRKRISRKIFVITLVFLFLFIAVLFPAFSVYKYARSDPQGVSISEALGKAGVTISGQDGVNIVNRFFEIIRIQTLSGFFTANYVQYYPQTTPYLKGESFSIVLSAMVPRIINSDKPNVSDYINKLSYDAGMGNEKSPVVSRTFLNAISEFYINFGPLGVFLLSILQGIYLQARFDWLIRRSRFSLGFPVYAAGFFGSAAFSHTLVLDSKNFIVWIILLWFLSHYSKNTSKVKE